MASKSKYTYNVSEKCGKFLRYHTYTLTYFSDSCYSCGFDEDQCNSIT